MMDWSVLSILVGIGLLMYLTTYSLNRFRKRKIRRKEWEKDKISLFLLLIQSIIVVASIVVNSVFRPVTHQIIIAENLINIIVFFLAFMEGFHTKRILSTIVSTVLLILFLISS